MNDIGPGDWVEACCPITIKRAGTVPYVVTEVIPSDPAILCDVCYKANSGIKLKGLPNGKGKSSFCVAHWRPVYRPKSSIIESLKTPIKIPA